MGCYDQYTCSWLCSCRTYFCCFPLALANIRPWPLVPFFQISLNNSELKTTHNTFGDCRVHFFRQPFSKQLFLRCFSNFEHLLARISEYFTLRPGYPCMNVSLMFVFSGNLLFETGLLVREFKLYVYKLYGKQQKSDSSWEFLKIENKQIKTSQNNSCG